MPIDARKGKSDVSRLDSLPPEVAALGDDPANIAKTARWRKQ
jgi:hypothetical protein